MNEFSNSQSIPTPTVIATNLPNLAGIGHHQSTSTDALLSAASSPHQMDSDIDVNVINQSAGVRGNSEASRLYDDDTGIPNAGFRQPTRTSNDSRTSSPRSKAFALSLPLVLGQIYTDSSVTVSDDFKSSGLAFIYTFFTSNFYFNIPRPFFFWPAGRSFVKTPPTSVQRIDCYPILVLTTRPKSSLVIRVYLSTWLLLHTSLTPDYQNE